MFEFIIGLVAGVLIATWLKTRAGPLPQQIVFDAVKSRGYVDPWTLREFVQRQVIKLYEELGELAHAIPTGDSDLNYHGQMSYMISRALFRANTVDDDVDMDFNKALEEITDLQVVLFCIAAILGFDIVRAAKAKATKDIARGVSRKEN